jgi:predicted outer membrane protein
MCYVTWVSVLSSDKEGGRTLVKRFSLFVIVIAVVYCCALSTGLAQQSPDQTQNSSDASSIASPSLVKAIEENAMQVDLARLALAKSENPRVRMFAQGVASDHVVPLRELQQLSIGQPATGPDASTSPVTLSKGHQDLRDRLSQLSPEDFDREYVMAMAREDREVVPAIERLAEAQTAGNTKVASAAVRQKPGAYTVGVNTTADEVAIAQELLPKVRRELARAEDLGREIGGAGIMMNVSGEDGVRHNRSSQ